MLVGKGVSDTTGGELLDRVRQLHPHAKRPLLVPSGAWADGRALSDPSNTEIAEAAGAPAGVEEHAFDLVIVGAGAAGLSAAVYGASEGLRTLVVDEGGIGGQIELADPQLPGFPQGPQRCPSC